MGDCARGVASSRRRLKTMAASLYIVVEGEDPGFDTYVHGHAIARNEDALDRIATKLHVRPLLEEHFAGLPARLASYDLDKILNGGAPRAERRERVCAV